MAAAAGAELPKIGKRGSKNKQQEQEPPPPPQPIKLTKLEQQMFKVLTSMKIPFELFAQYAVKVPGEQRPYAIDFAYPRIGVGVEVDGAIWHQRPDFQQRDLMRDQKLAKVGWRILRFRENAIEDQLDMVRETIHTHVLSAAKQHKAAEDEGKMIKVASLDEGFFNSVYEYMLQNEGKIGCYRQPTAFGEILHIGTVADE